MMITTSSTLPTGIRFAHNMLLMAGAMVLVAAVFWPALHGGFIFDDYPIFAENDAIQVHGWHWDQWLHVWHWAQAHIQRPLAMLTYAFNYAVGGSTFGFKLTNLVIHLLNMLLLMQLTQRLLQAAWPLRDARHNRYLALAIAALWAVHPLQVSTVMYVVQRMEMLAFTFVLLALLAYWRGRQMQMQQRTAWPWLLLAAALTGAGYAFKETAVLVPGYAMLLELTLLRFRAGNPLSEKLWRTFYGTGFLAAAIILVFYAFPHYAHSGAFDGREFTAAQRELTQLRALPLYLGWILLPLPSHLTFYYDNYVASTGLLHPATTLLGALCVLGLLAIVAATYRRRPLLALGIGWFFVAHVLTCAPLPLELIFEHRNYPALFGILLAVVDIACVLTRYINPKIVLVIASVFALNLIFLTVLRASVWGSPFRLSVELVQINPQSSRAAMDLARRLMAMSGGDATTSLYGKSIMELEHAARLPNASPLPEEALLIQASTHPGMPTQPWWDSFRNKLQTRPLIPDSYQTLHRLSSLRLSGETGIDATQLASCLALAIQRVPSRQLLHSDYAELAGAVLHDPALAIQHWNLALALDPDAGEYGRRLAGYLVESGRNAEAVAVIAKTMELRPALQSDPQLIQWRQEAQSRANAKAPPQAPEHDPSEG